jgi:hypothetical protein
MGDSMVSDFHIKLGCIHFNKDVKSYLADIDTYICDPRFKEILSFAHISVVAASELRSIDVRNFYRNDPEINTADVYFFDYDSNFKDLAEKDMFSAHDQIYNNVFALARMSKGSGKKLVYIASQVKTGYYKSEFIPLQALAESNRKQAIVDLVITLNSDKSEENNAGIINIPKARRGLLGHTPFTILKSGRMMEIDLKHYHTLKSKIKTSRVIEESTDYSDEE